MTPVVRSLFEQFAVLLLEHLDAVIKPVTSTVYLLNSIDLELSSSTEACSSTGMTPNVADIIRI